MMIMMMHAARKSEFCFEESKKYLNMIILTKRVDTNHPWQWKIRPPLPRMTRGVRKTMLLHWLKNGLSLPPFEQ